MERIELLETLLDIENGVSDALQSHSEAHYIRRRILERMLQAERDLRKAQADLLDEAEKEGKP